MRIIVQKFGGTSLSTRQARERAIHHIQRALREGYMVVVVVSAMGRQGDPYATDTLLGLVRDNGNRLPTREQDLLLACGEIISATTLCSILGAVDIPATVLTGAQAGICTDARFRDARIRWVKPERIIEGLRNGKVVIVTGFQGCTEDGEITTLGRGGSDTTATAIGAALQAEIVEIYTDVNGILTADPKIVHDARPLMNISYSEICNLANYGAKVIHPRAVEIAMHAKIPLRIRSTFSDLPGTLVGQWPANRESWIDEGQGNQERIKDRLVTGIAHVDNITQVQVEAEVPYQDLHVHVFQAMATAGISVDFINVNPSGVVYTVRDEDAMEAARVLHELGLTPRLRPNCAKVAVIGGGINGVPGIMSKIVSALSAQQISILQSADSNTTIWVLVNRSDMEMALRALHEQFDLARI